MRTYYKTYGHQEAQEESSNTAISSEPPTSATNKAASRNRNPDVTEEEFPLPPPSSRERLDFLDQFGLDLEQVASEPSTSDLAPSPKISKLSDQLWKGQSMDDFSCVQEDTREEFPPLPPLSLEEVLDFLDKFEQDTEEVTFNQSESDLCPTPKRNKESGPLYAPSTVTRKRTREDTSEDLLKTVNGAELTKLLEQFGQEMRGVASEPFEGNMCPSPKRTNVSDYQPSTNQTMAGSSNILATATREMYLEENKPYIKKPLNAFMLFKAAQRWRVALELGIKDSATVSRELGRRWKMLSEVEKASYFEEAHKVRSAHRAKYPNWSAKDNYGKKVKQRKTAPNFHHFDFPANQHPVAYATGPTSFPSQDQKGPYYPIWGPIQHPYYQPGGPYQGPNYQPGGPYQGPHYQPGGQYQGPNYQPGGPSQGPYYQDWGPSQGPYNQPEGPYQGPNYQPGGPYHSPNYQPGGPYQGPHYQPEGPCQGPNYQPGGPNQGPYYQDWGPNQGPYNQACGPSEEPSGDTVTDNDQAPNDQVPNDQAPNDQV